MAKEDEARGGRTGGSAVTTCWLVRLGYAGERVMRGVHVYRLNLAGAGLQAADWTEPPA
jgi:hypothetical protein